MAWSAARYLTFEAERTRPARDLLAQVGAPVPGGIYDLGCGPGNSTELIAARFPEATTVGIDSDADMLAAARRRQPDIAFRAGDLACWVPDAPAALLFANAVLQWLPDPLATIARLTETLAPGGTIAVQMPDNLDEPTHRAMRDVAAQERFAAAYPGGMPLRSALPSPAACLDRLSSTTTRIDVWHTVYYHRLAGPEAIVDWVMGTGLRPYIAPLPDALRAAYLEDYLERIREAYPPLEDGGVLLRFPRFFLLATRR